MQLGNKLLPKSSKFRGAQYRELSQVTDRIALRDLTELCEKEIFQRKGAVGRGAEYTLIRHKSAIRNLKNMVT